MLNNDRLAEILIATPALVKICLALREAGAQAGTVNYEMRTDTLARLTGVSEADLADHIATLKSHNLVTVQREIRSSTNTEHWVTLTTTGQQAEDDAEALLRQGAKG